MRCINLDWLEVYVAEPIAEPRDADFYRQQGFYVEVREYGTRVYEEMFTLFSNVEHFPFIEVRRRPKSGGVLPINAAHVRFNNRYCYYDNAGEIMLQFLQRYGLSFVSISRVDICLDFVKFDRGDDPEKFIKRYIGHKYAKINQAQARAFFNDEWERREFNSLSWGSKSSDVTTKLYNKTLELYDESVGAFRKPYILQSWFAAGIIDDPVKCLKCGDDGAMYHPTVWRLEFSINSNVRGWLKIKKNGNAGDVLSIRNTLEQYANRTLLVPVFDLLQQHYFHFKKFRRGVSKYNCPDKVLFDFNAGEEFYRVIRPASPAKPEALIARLLKYLQAYQLTAPAAVHDACFSLLQELERANAARFVNNPHSNTEVRALRQAISLKMQGNQRDAMSIYHELLEQMQCGNVY